MKTKLQFDGAAIKDFFIRNGEKLVLAATVVILVMFVMGVFKAEPLPADKPQQIANLAKQKQTQITSGADDPEIELPAPPNFEAKMQRSMSQVPLAALKHPIDISAPLFPELMKRADPEIYPPTELAAVGVAGLVPYSPPELGGPEGGGNVRPRAFGGGRPNVAPRRQTGRAFGEDEMYEPSPRRTARTPAFGRGLDGGLAGVGGGIPFVEGARATGAEALPKYQVVVTGIIDVAKQMEEYLRRFEYAEKPPTRNTGESDEPHYYFAMIQRAEATDANPENLNWQTLDIKGAVVDAGKWATTAPEVVDPSYVFAKEPLPNMLEQISVTWDLPPLYLKAWGREASHPKLPKKTDEPLQPQPADRLPDNLPAAPSPFLPGGQPGASAPGVGAAGGVPGVGAAGPGAGRGRFMDEQMRGFGHGATPGAGRNPYPVGLFRYVDTTAEPGKSYRYRAQIWMHNPNFNIHPQFLEKAESATTAYLRSEWSEPTAPVRTPDAHRLLAASVEAPRTATGDATAKVNLLTFVREKGTLPPVPTKLVENEEDGLGPGRLDARGRPTGQAGSNPLAPPSNPLAPMDPSELGPPAPGGFPGFGAATAPLEPVWMLIAKEFELGLGQVAGAKDVTIEHAVDMSSESTRRLEKLTLDTGTMLLDLRNDTALAGPRSTGPGELLLMDEAGRLTVIDATADRVVFKNYQDQTAAFVPAPVEEPVRRGIEDEELDEFGPRGRQPRQRRGP